MFQGWAKYLLIPAALTTAHWIPGLQDLDPARSAEARAIEYLKREVPSWSKNHKCFSCHNNGDGARALYSAAGKGYAIPVEVLADTTEWVGTPGRWEHNKGDPGFSDKRLANIQFGASLLAAIQAGRLNNTAALQEAARKIAADQGPDGAWQIEPANALGSPATYGTSVATYVGLMTLKEANAPGTQDAIREAERWLRRVPANNIPATAIMLLASSRDSTKVAIARQAKWLNLIRRAQARDGGWGPYADSPPEPFDTALALLALSEFVQRPGVNDSVRRGRSFLAGQQSSDGSWPPTTRPPGGESYAQRVSTTSWATLALLASRK